MNYVNIRYCNQVLIFLLFCPMIPTPTYKETLYKVVSNDVAKIEERHTCKKQKLLGLNQYHCTKCQFTTL